MEDLERLALETLAMNKQAIIFAPSRASAEKTAEDLAKLTRVSLPLFAQEILKAGATPTKQCRRLSHCVMKGVAFHHAGLWQKQRDFIEEEFKKGTIVLICATPTLAAGVDFPAFRVILRSLKRFSGQWGMNWIPVLEYLQMAGRAGRPKYETFGEAICLAKDEQEKEEIYERFICGVPEDISSKLAVEPVLRKYLLSLVAAGIIVDEKSMRDFFQRTFWAHQFGDMMKLEGVLRRMAHLLTEWGFVVAQQEDFVEARSMKLQGILRATPLGRRVSELYLDPLTARYLLDCLQSTKETKRAVFSLLQMISHTLEMRPLLAVKAREEEFIQKELLKRHDSLLEKEPALYDLEYGEFLNSIKTALFFEAWIEEHDEEYLLEAFDIRPGEVRVKLEVADWLLYATEELAVLQHFDTRAIHRLRERLKYGVREELLTLLRLKGIGRVRARKLYANGIKDLGDMKKADVVTLGQILGKAVAEDVKKQLGEEIQEILPSKRKGQLSIERFGNG